MNRNLKLNYYQQIVSIKRPTAPLKELPLPQYTYKITWINPKSKICQNINGQSKCFCNHAFKYHQHNTKSPYCLVVDCQCKCYSYVPAKGVYDLMCICKHSFKDHDALLHRCNRNRCNSCAQFNTGWTCSCGYRYQMHETLIEKLNNSIRNKQTIDILDQYLNDKTNQHQSISSQRQKVKQEIKRKCLDRINSKFKQNGKILLDNYSLPFMNKYNQQHQLY